MSAANGHPAPRNYFEKLTFQPRTGVLAYNRPPPPPNDNSSPPINPWAPQSVSTNPGDYRWNFFWNLPKYAQEHQYNDGQRQHKKKKRGKRNRKRVNGYESTQQPEDDEIQFEEPDDDDDDLQILQVVLQAEESQPLEARASPDLSIRHDGPIIVEVEEDEEDDEPTVIYIKDTDDEKFTQMVDNLRARIEKLEQQKVLQDSEDLVKSFESFRRSLEKRRHGPDGIETMNDAVGPMMERVREREEANQFSDLTPMHHSNRSNNHYGYSGNMHQWRSNLDDLGDRSNMEFRDNEGFQQLRQQQYNYGHRNRLPPYSEVPRSNRYFFNSGYTQYGTPMFGAGNNRNNNHYGYSGNMHEWLSNSDDLGDWSNMEFTDNEGFQQLRQQPINYGHRNRLPHYPVVPRSDGIFFNSSYTKYGTPIFGRNAGYETLGTHRSDLPGGSQHPGEDRTIPGEVPNTETAQYSMEYENAGSGHVRRDFSQAGFGDAQSQNSVNDPTFSVAEYGAHLDPSRCHVSAPESSSMEPEISTAPELIKPVKQEQMEAEHPAASERRNHLKVPKQEPIDPNISLIERMRVRYPGRVADFEILKQTLNQKKAEAELREKGRDSAESSDNRVGLDEPCEEGVEGEEENSDTECMPHAQETDYGHQVNMQVKVKESRVKLMPFHGLISAADVGSMGPKTGYEDEDDPYSMDDELDEIAAHAHNEPIVENNVNMSPMAPDTINQSGRGCTRKVNDSLRSHNVTSYFSPLPLSSQPSSSSSTSNFVLGTRRRRASARISERPSERQNLEEEKKKKKSASPVTQVSRRALSSRKTKSPIRFQ